MEGTGIKALMMTLFHVGDQLHLIDMLKCLSILDTGALSFWG